MSDFATGDLLEPGSREKGMSEKQQKAMAALRCGSSFPQAAEAAGVNRSTVHRWVQNDPQFRARYNAWQQEMVESSRARLLTMLDKAVDVIGKALDRGDEQTAVAMLRNIGVMRRPGRQATDPEMLSLEMNITRHRETYRLGETLAKHMLGKVGLSDAEQKEYLRQYGLAGLQKQLEKADAKAPHVTKSVEPEHQSGTEPAHRQGDRGDGQEDRSDGQGDKAFGSEAQARRGTGGQGDDGSRKLAGDATMQRPTEAAANASSNTTAAQNGDKPFSDEDLREAARVWAEEICREDEDATAGGLLHDSVGQRKM